MRAGGYFGVIAVVLTVGGGRAQAAISCSPVTFPGGQTSVTLQAHVPDLAACYWFAAQDGQMATLEVSQGDDMSLGVDTVPHGSDSLSQTDSQSTPLPGEGKRLQFKTQDRDYRIFVGSRNLRDIDTTQIFSLTITLK